MTNAYRPKFPELWSSNLIEGVDYEVRGVYRFQDDDGNWVVRTDRFPINNVVQFPATNEGIKP